MTTTPQRRRPSYSDSRYWLRYQRFFPADLRSTAREPAEHWWRWRGMDVHIDRLPDPNAPAKALVLHGAGGYGRMLAPYARLAAAAGLETLAPDLPGYGLTMTGDRRVDYPMWVDCARDLVVAERARDPRPIIALGASMGGLLAYSVAADGGDVAAVVATCLLDPRRADARRAAARTPALGAVAAPLLTGMPRPLARLRPPIKWLVNMGAMSADPELNAVVAADPIGGGNRVPLGFLRTYLHSAPPVEPEDFTACPLVLAHPERDRWTPPELSLAFYDRLACRKRYVPLTGGGHMPIEGPAIDDLASAVPELLAELGLAGRPDPGRRTLD